MNITDMLCEQKLSINSFDLPTHEINASNRLDFWEHNEPFEGSLIGCFAPPALLNWTSLSSTGGKSSKKIRKLQQRNHQEANNLHMLESCY